MRKEAWRAVRVTLLLAAVLCGLYPGAVWLVGRLAFGERASGGLVLKDGKPVGARLIGQAFSRPGYFHGRPSAAGQDGYDASNSSGSNLGPTNRKLVDRIAAEADRLVRENPGLSKGKIPGDLLTASGSGLDPHISPDAARAQVERVARARGMEIARAEALVRKHTDGPQWGFLGEPTVNVLILNLELDGAGGGKE